MSISLERVALRAMVDNGFQPEPPGAARREVAALPDTPRDGVRDLRRLRWSSIDNVTSKDLDQIEVAEAMSDGGIRLRIAIADVDALVPKGSAVDAHAAGNSTSVYTGISVFPMLPDALSTDRTSLVEGGERLVVVTELEIGKDGAVRRHDIYRALAVNHAKLDYESVGAWLEGRGPEPDKIAADDGLEAQLWLQDRAAGLLKRLREQAGVLDLDTVAVTPVAKDGVIESLRVSRKNRARDLIEDFMIAANGAVARFLAAAGRSAIRRVVREPRRWDRIADIAASYGIRLPAAPDGKALSAFLAARRAADPLRFPDLSLSVVKLLGPGEYILIDRAPRTTSATSACRRPTTRTRPPPIAATPTWSRSAW